MAQDVTASEALIEDACSYAWWQLLRHRERVVLDSGAFWWLHRVAVRRAWRLGDQQRRELPVGTPADFSASTQWDNDPASIAERRETLRGVDRLPARQRRLLLTRSAGFTAAEIARTTGDSPATIGRQLRGARQGLRAS